MLATGNSAYTVALELALRLSPANSSLKATAFPASAVSVIGAPLSKKSAVHPPKLSPQPSTQIVMKTNVGSLDRIARIILGLVILAAGYYYQNWFGLIGIGPIATAVFGVCPAYLPFGLSTCKKPKT